MATTAKPRRSRSATTGAATEPTATEPTATEAVTTEATATEANGAPAATSGSEPTTANGQTTPATDAAATGPDPYVMIVAGQMSGKPDGITGPDLVKAAGLAPGKTAVVLAAMEISGAAIRVPAETPDGDDLWILSDTDKMSMVDLASVPTHCVCKCGHTHRRQITVTVSGRRGGTPGTNGDGNPTFKKGELRAKVRDFVRENPGHVFTDSVIAKELGQRLNRHVHPGGVYVAVNKLVADGELALANPTDPRDRRVMAPATADSNTA
jgi:hypothetical protein